MFRTLTFFLNYVKLYIRKDPLYVKKAIKNAPNQRKMTNFASPLG